MRDSTNCSADLEPERVRPLLKTNRYGRILKVVDSTGSTNDDARSEAEAGAPSGSVVVADTQSAGRGSRGRCWSSLPGTDLYLSIVDRPGLPPDRLPLLSLAVGLGVAEAAAALVGNQPPVSVKWPNDVWIEGKKCAGILIETSSSQTDTVVIGIGLNVNRRQWPADLAATAVSLVQAAGAPQNIDRSIALGHVLNAVEPWVDRLVREGPKPIVAALDRRLALRGAAVRCENIQGVLIGISENGSALIRTEEGVRECISGTLLPATEKVSNRPEQR